MDMKKNIFEAGKIPYWCPTCHTVFMLLPDQPKRCIDGSELKQLNDQELRSHDLINSISEIMKVSDEVAKNLIDDIKEDVKNGLHVVIGIYGGVLDEIEVFIEDTDATEYEKKLCEKYGIPFDKEERQEYYDSDGEHEVHHWITKLNQGVI